MKIKLTLHYVIAFLALTFVMHEAHEIVHTSVGRLICGCWGQRDFNAWGICENCSERNALANLATFAGPLFTFSMIWMGAFLISQQRTDKQKALGFSLIFANLPFARILTAALGSGDEVWGLSLVLSDRTAGWSVGLLLVLLFTIYPLVKAFLFIKNKQQTGWFMLFLLLPIVIDVLVVLGVLNFLLQSGVLSEYWILGSPMLVTLWSLFAVAVFVLTRSGIYKLSRN